MVACRSPVADRGRWREECAQDEELLQSSSPSSACRALVYDAETGSLRFSKPLSDGDAGLSPRSPRSPPTCFELVPPPSPSPSPSSGHHKLGDAAAAAAVVVVRIACLKGVHEGGASPTCVLRNSAVRSASSSPARAGSRGASKAAHEVTSPARRAQRNGDPVAATREILAEVGEAANCAHEHAMPESPFKSMAKAKKSKHRGSATSTASSALATPGGVFSFNAAYMPPQRAGHRDAVLDSDLSEPQAGASRRTFSLAPLMLSKPTPSKWDDAEKWLPGSECQSATTRARASRSGPLLAQMVAAQAGMSIPWRGAITAPGGSPAEARHHGHDHHLSTAAGVAPSQRDRNGVEEAAEERLQTPGSPHALVGFAARDHEQRNLDLLHLRGRCAAQNSPGLRPSREGSGTQFAPLRDDAEDGDGDGDGSASPSPMNGSFLRLGARMEKPQAAVEFSLSSEVCVARAALADFADLADLESKPGNPRVSETRDMGTAMTPAASVDASLTSTPLRDAATRTEPKYCVVQMGSDHDARFAVSEKEIQERKTRQEIVALGTQLGKASIAAAWAARESTEKRQESLSGATSGSIDEVAESEKTVSKRDATASRAEWQEAETAKYTARFEQDKAKIRAWEEHEKAKAEAEMRKAEVRAERLRSRAHEKLARRLGAARRRADDLAAVAEARRADAAAKVARKAHVLKAHGKSSNLLFLSSFCS